MSKIRRNYGSGVARPKIGDKTHFELKRQFLKELCENTFSGSEHEDVNEHIEKVLVIVDLFHIPEVTQDLIMLRAFPMSLTGAATIQAQLNSLGREIKKVDEKVYAAQVRCELCKGPHYTKDYPLKEEGKTLEEDYYTQFGESVSVMPFSTYTNLGLEPKMDQDEEFEPTLDFVKEPTYKSCYEMKFSCMIGYRHVNADFLPTLSINMIIERFYNSIIKDKGFSIIDDVDITSGVMLDMLFCKKFMS
nr:hypothetical protein [Tanacetum cinerariifolium]